MSTAAGSHLENVSDWSGRPRRSGGCGSKGLRSGAACSLAQGRVPARGGARGGTAGGRAGEEATRRAPCTPCTPHCRRSCSLRGDGRGPRPSRRLPTPRAHQRPGEHARPSHSRGLGASPRPGTPRGEHSAPLETPYPRFCRSSLWTQAPDSTGKSEEDRNPLSYSKPEQGVQK